MDIQALAVEVSVLYCTTFKLELWMNLFLDALHRAFHAINHNSTTRMYIGVLSGNASESFTFLSFMEMTALCRYVSFTSRRHP